MLAIVYLTVTVLFDYSRLTVERYFVSRVTDALTAGSDLAFKKISDCIE